MVTKEDLINVIKFMFLLLIINSVLIIGLIGTTCHLYKRQQIFAPLIMQDPTPENEAELMELDHLSIELEEIEYGIN